MTEMTPGRWANTCAYLREVFGREDEHTRWLAAEARRAGLPDIAVSPDVGRLLLLLTGLSNAGLGARVAIEVGTLAGYSATWIARGLSPGGRLYTVEPELRHAEVAQAGFRRAGLTDRITLIRDPAPGSLVELARALGPASADLVFLDAVKRDYAEYLRVLRPVLKVGGLLIADNALGSTFWIDDPPGSSPERDAIDAFNRLVAGDPDFQSCCVPIREGVLIARRVR